MAEETTTGATSVPDESVSTEPEMVSITDATDEDLDAYLDSESLDNQSESIDVEEEDNQPETEKVDPEEEQQTVKQPTQEEIAAQQLAMQQQLERYNKQLQGQELLIHRQISKIGEYKRQLIEMNQQLMEGLGDKQLEDPRGAEVDRLKLNQNQNQIDDLSRQEQALSQRANFMRTITKYIPPTELPPVDDLCECLRADGLDEAALDKFREDPSFMNPSTFIQLQRRAKAEKAFKQVLPALIQLVGENKNLKQQLANGRKNILSNVERVARQTPSVTNARPVANKTPEFIDVTKLTDAELDELLRRGQV